MQCSDYDWTSDLLLSFLVAKAKREQAELHGSHYHGGRSLLCFWVSKPQVHFSPGSPHGDYVRHKTFGNSFSHKCQFLSAISYEGF